LHDVGPLGVEAPQSVLPLLPLPLLLLVPLSLLLILLPAIAFLLTLLAEESLSLLLSLLQQLLRRFKVLLPLDKGPSWAVL